MTSSMETTRPLNICLICSELLGWGAAGGYGFATRGIARELAALGHRITAVIPQPRGKTEQNFELDGFTVIGYPRRRILDSRAIYRSLNADIYHSQEPSLSTYLAQLAAPQAVHLVTSRDPRDRHDWLIEMRYPTFSRLRLLPTYFFYENPATHRAVRHAARVFVPAHCLVNKVNRKYRLNKAPSFLPTPVRVPEHIRKASRPTVCFVGRLDRRKQPERFMALAPLFPGVDFLVAGSAQDAGYEQELKDSYGRHGNLQLLGFIDQFADQGLSEVYSRSWIMINTAAREGLPNSFIEAAAHGCAIISAVDPDGFASRFGVLAKGDGFANALQELLDGDRWQELGQAGRDYVRATNSPEVAVAAHLEQYYSALKTRESNH